MSYVASSYNYATPLSSAAGLTSESSVVADKKYFTLSDNVLDGSYVPISGDVGIWGAEASDASGVLSTPFVVTVTDTLTMNAVRLVASQYCYPVEFTIKLYNGTTLLRTITEAANTKAEYIRYLPQTLNVTSYEVSITKVSQPGAVARLYNAYNLGYVKRADTLRLHQAAASLIDNTVIDRTITGSDTLMIGTVNDASTVHNTIDVRVDTLLVKQVGSSAINNTAKATDRIIAKLTESTSHVRNTIAASEVFKVKHDGYGTLTNVHTRMKDPSRRVYGKVYITYTDPLLDSETTITTNMEAYNSIRDQVMDSESSTEKYFTLYENNLTGEYRVMHDKSQVGWVSGVVSDSDGVFVDEPYLRMSFSTRPVTPLTIHFNETYGCTARDFSVTFVRSDGTSTTNTFVDNDLYQVVANEDVMLDVDAIIIKVNRVTKPRYPVSILEATVMSTILYEGYNDHSDLMGIDLLEELTYEDDVEALGGISANETTVTIDNSDKSFYFNNKNSAVSSQLRRNRKIEPWLGTEIVPGEIEWYKLGTFWSYRWNVPVNGLVATAVGFDTIGLLDTTSYIDHYVYIDKSIGELIEIVLSNAKASLGFVAWKIDPALYDIVIPFAWFEARSHTAALRKISKCYPMHIYCDRDNNICAAPQKLKLDFYYDTWSDSTNVISKDYSSLYTTLPNIVNVQVKLPKLVENDNLVQDDFVFNVSTTPTRTLNFSKPAVGDIVVDVDMDLTVSYTYVAYSWGIVFTFAGTGNVRSITCNGTSVDVSETSTATRRDENSIRLNGAVTRDISADFIQTSELANEVLDRIFALSEYDKYDASVEYRGDIALTINNPILLQEGIAPDNRYNIRRHQLSWNGALSGTADLNT